MYILIKTRAFIVSIKKKFSIKDFLYLVDILVDFLEEYTNKEIYKIKNSIFYV